MRIFIFSTSSKTKFQDLQHKNFSLNLLQWITQQKQMFLIPPYLNIKTKTDYWRRRTYCSFPTTSLWSRSLQLMVVLRVLLKALTGVILVAGTNFERREHEEQKSSTALLCASDVTQHVRCQRQKIAHGRLNSAPSVLRSTVAYSGGN